MMDMVPMVKEFLRENTVWRHWSPPLRFYNPSALWQPLMFPEALDYDFDEKYSKLWHRFHKMLRPSTSTFELPEKIGQFTGKVVYFSMGSMGHLMVDMMRRLINILANHRTAL